MTGKHRHREMLEISSFELFFCHAVVCVCGYIDVAELVPGNYVDSIMSMSLPISVLKPLKGCMLPGGWEVVVFVPCGI